MSEQFDSIYLNNIVIEREDMDNYKFVPLQYHTKKGFYDPFHEDWVKVPKNLFYFEGINDVTTTGLYLREKGKWTQYFPIYKVDGNGVAENGEVITTVALNWAQYGAIIDKVSTIKYYITDKSSVFFNGIEYGIGQTVNEKGGRDILLTAADIPTKRSTAEYDIETLFGTASYLQEEIDTLSGAIGRVPAHNFETATPTQEQLTEYIISLGKTVHNGIAVKNLFDQHLWLYTDEMQEFTDQGVDTANAFTNSTQGLIMGAEGISGGLVEVGDGTGRGFVPPPVEDLRGTVKSNAAEYGVQFDETGLGTIKEATTEVGGALSASDKFKLNHMDIGRYANLPAGSIIAVPTKNNIDGYLKCNGQTVSKTKYPELFDVLGYTFGGSGDNFQVPDIRDYGLRGAKQDSEIGTKAGSDTTTLTTENLPQHRHDMSHSQSVSVSGSTSSAGSHTHRWHIGQFWTNLNPGEGNQITTMNPGMTQGYDDTSSAGSHTHSFSGSGTSSYSGNTGYAGSGTPFTHTGPHLKTNFFISTGLAGTGGVRYEQGDNVIFTPQEDGTIVISAPGMDVYIPVTELPEVGVTGKIYMLWNDETESYDLWIYENEAWAQSGKTNINLANFYNKAEVDDKLKAKADQADVDEIKTNMATKADLDQIKESAATKTEVSSDIQGATQAIKEWTGGQLEGYQTHEEAKEYAELVEGQFEQAKEYTDEAIGEVETELGQKASEEQVNAISELFDLQGNALGANKLATKRKIALTGAAVGEVEFDGSEDVEMEVVIPGASVSGTINYQQSGDRVYINGTLPEVNKQTWETAAVIPNTIEPPVETVYAVGSWANQTNSYVKEIRIQANSRNIEVYSFDEFRSRVNFSYRCK
jgi:microcystin-dependent protein